MRSRRMWKLVAVALSILALGSFIVAIQFYYWPSATSVPRPDLGRTYALNNHGENVYLTRGEWRTQLGFEIAAGVLFVLAIIIAYASGEMKSQPAKLNSWWTKRQQRLGNSGGNWRPY